MAERFYRVLLRLYPQSYLNEYREPMEQAFRDQLRDARTGSQRTRLYWATLRDACRSLPLSHGSSGRPRLLALFAAMSAGIFYSAAAGVGPKPIGLWLTVCALTMGYLDPQSERIYGGLARRWSFRLVIVTLLANGLLGHWPWSLTRFVGICMGSAYVGAWLRAQRSPEFAEFVDYREPLILDLGLRDNAGEKGNDR